MNLTEARNRIVDLKLSIDKYKNSIGRGYSKKARKIHTKEVMEHLKLVDWEYHRRVFPDREAYKEQFGWYYDE